MVNLLKFEFRKIRTQKVLFISLIIFFIIHFINALSTRLLLDAFDEEFYGISTAEQIIYSADNFIFTLVSVIVTVVIVCRDYEWGIVKNVYAKGYKRESVYLSKFLYTAFCATALYVFEILITALTYGLFFGFEWVGGKGVAILFTQYASVIACFAFYYAVASITKKMSSALIISIVAPSIISLILSLLTFAFKIEDFSLSSYWISSFMGSLTDYQVTTKRIIECAVCSVIYIGVFTVGGLFINRTTEV